MREIAAVLVGGIVGSALRLLADTLIPHESTGFPYSTLLVNVVGSFMLGLIVARFWSGISPWLKAGLGTGMIGSFTTFSAVMVSLVEQATKGLWLLAIVYVLLTLVLGFAAAAIGLRVGRVATPIDWVDE
ncbi:MAG: CrcB family protein [Cryobacterium sp.]|nr:CrcB family protein [Cryobacterium sp.]